MNLIASEGYLTMFNKHVSHLLANVFIEQPSKLSTQTSAEYVKENR